MKTQTFQIETFENVTLRNVYEVEAETPEQALRFLKDGMEPYNPHPFNDWGGWAPCNR